MSIVAARQQSIVEEFAQLSSWEDRYKKIIALGKELTVDDEELQQDKYLVKGCQSRVWLKAQYQENQMQLTADSDALIVRGLVALLMRVYSGVPPQDVLSSSTDFIGQLGFTQYLSPSRANGLRSMLKQIMLYAQALSLTQANHS